MQSKIQVFIKHQFFPHKFKLNQTTFNSNQPKLAFQTKNITYCNIMNQINHMKHNSKS